jgi:cyclic beta-1,2-glucan synthetase
LGLLFLGNLLFSTLSAKPGHKNHARLHESQRGTIEGYCAAMWNYFETYCTEEHHFLPPDNVQETPVFRVAARSSPTNLGLYLLCVLAARDLRLIDSDGLALRLGRTLASIDQLETWNGHLLNWYDTRTLRPLEPRYVSTVDSGNFLVAIRTLRRGLEEYAPECPALAPLLPRLQALEKGCDLRALYHPRRKLFHIGFDLQTQKPSQSYYDLLMSEARMTSCYAIATGAVPKKHWGALGRTLARQGRFAGPVSWTGTMFEYFMPYLFLPAPKGTLGYEALRFCLNCQRGRAAKAARGRQLPWGISESGFYAFDAELNYQYKAHGVQKLGLRRGLDDELVLAPYASFLAMPLAPRSALANLKRFARMELQGSCGFYEAADATPARACGQDYAAVRSYMAHHVGMSLLAALNTLQNGVLQKRFFSDSEMARVQDLLQERIPDRGVVYRDVELRDAPRPRERVSSAKECFAAADPANPKTHLLTNGEWGCVLTDCGAGAAFYRGVSMLRHNPDLLRHPGGVLPLLREQGRPPVSITPAPHGNARKTKIEFSAAEAVFAGEGTQVAASMRVRVHPRLPAEERRFTLKNTSKQTAAGALWVYFEPWLAPPQTTHPAFSKLFLRDSYDESTGIATFLRRRAETGESLCLAAGMTTEATCERLRERALPRGLLFGAAPVTAPQTARPAAGDCCGAFTVEYTLQAGESRAFSLWLCAGISRMEASQRLAHLREESNGKRRGTETGGKSPFRDGEMAAALAKQVLPRLLYYTPLAPAQTAARKNAVARRKALWPLGISGEEPYLYLSLAGEEEVPSVLPWLRLCRVLRAAGVPCALAIGYREGGDYNTPMTAALRQALVRERCAHLLQGGIYLLNLNGADAKATEALPVYAAHICGGEGGWHPRECPVAPPLCLQATNAGPVCEPETEKALHTGCGTFLPGRFVIEKREGAPTVPWSHVLANPAFGTLVSDSALGCTWAVNARENKLTPWENDPCGDNRGELLLLKFGNQVFDLCLGARCELTPAAVRWQGEIHGLAYEITAWVPAKGLCKQVEITLRNQTARTLTPELTYYTEPVLGVGREPQLPLLGEALPDGLLLHAPDAGVRGCAALLMTGGADIRCVDRGAFWHGNWHAGGTLPQGDPCAAVGWRLQIPPMAEAVATFALTWGANRNAALCAHLVAVKEAPPANTPLRVRLPNPALCAMVNTWLPHQILTARLYGRTGHYQCGGAYGMRDQLQDVSAFFMTQPALARRQIARCAAAQFPEGDAMHWWHRLPGHVTRGVRTRYADDYLWLPYITADYCLATGDTAFLRVKIPFRQGAPLGPEAHERYAGYPLGGERATLWAHCTRALDRALGLLGPHGLPLILGGDWNDSMNRVGVAGRGESVWLAMFLSAALRRFLRLCVPMGAPALEEKYRHAAARLDERVEAHAWAGDRYLRAFWDDGTPLGGKDGAPCAIDLLPQAFSILRTGDAAEEPPNAARIRQALDSAAERLLDREHGILRLLREPFLAARQGRRAGYINDYPPGVRENGGQYTHAAVWFAMALLRAGRTDEAYALLRMLNPADFCQDAGRMARYCGEPYALAGDVLGAPGREGRAGWTLYTGSAAWFWRCVVEELLGVRMENGQIKAAGPQYPAGWHKDDIAVWLGDTQVV